MIGVAFDGTGYGCDRSVWGGELLLMGTDVRRGDPGRPPGAVHPGGRRPRGAQPVPGRDRPARRPPASPTADGLRPGRRLPGRGTGRRRGRSWPAGSAACGPPAWAGSSTGSPRCSGCATRSPTRRRPRSSWRPWPAPAATAVPLTMDVEDGQLRLGTARARAWSRASGRASPAAALALGFHRALASATSRLVVRTAAEQGVDAVGLTGGVFQNRLLLDELTAALRTAGLKVLTHRLVPPNDGGLSLGQAAVGRARVAAAMRDDEDRRRPVTITREPAELHRRGPARRPRRRLVVAGPRFHAGATLW